MKEQTMNDQGGLVARQDALETEMRRLAKIDETCAAAAAALAALDAEARGLDQEEQEAWQQWAQDPKGELPSSRAAEREDLARRRVAAASALASSTNAQRATESRREELLAQARDVRASLRKRNLETALTAARKQAQDIGKIAADLCNRWESIMGLRQAMLEARAAAVKDENRDLATFVTEMIDRLDSIELPELKWKAQNVEAAAARWSESLR